MGDKLKNALNSRLKFEMLPYPLCAATDVTARMERSLGIMDHEQNVRPMGKAMNEVNKVLEELPFDTLPEKEYMVCDAHTIQCVDKLSTH